MTETCKRSLLPVISIITINYNNLEGLKKTFESVFKQTYRDFEYIVIDGGSTDGSKELIEKNNDKINYWVSESDHGIYNAMNKGINVANGEYLLFVNSGDKLCSDKVLKTCATELSGESLIYGNLLLSDNVGEQCILKEYPTKLSFLYFLNESLPHPATFIKKKSLIELGYFDENLKICSDWKFFILAICLNNLTYKKIEKVVSIFDTGGISSNIEYQDVILNEKEKILKENFPAFYDDYQVLSKSHLQLRNLKNSRIRKILSIFLKSLRIS